MASYVHIKSKDFYLNVSLYGYFLLFLCSSSLLNSFFFLILHLCKQSYQTKLFVVKQVVLKRRFPTWGTGALKGSQEKSEGSRMIKGKRKEIFRLHKIATIYFVYLFLVKYWILPPLQVSKNPSVETIGGVKNQFLAKPFTPRVLTEGFRSHFKGNFCVTRLQIPGLEVAAH